MGTNDHIPPYETDEQREHRKRQAQDRFFSRNPEAARREADRLREKEMERHVPRDLSREADRIERLAGITREIPFGPKTAADLDEILGNKEDNPA